MVIVTSVRSTLCKSSDDDSCYHCRDGEIQHEDRQLIHDRVTGACKADPHVDDCDDEPDQNERLRRRSQGGHIRAPATSKQTEYIQKSNPADNNPEHMYGELFPLNRIWRLAGHIIDHAVDALDLV